MNERSQPDETQSRPFLAKDRLLYDAQLCCINKKEPRRSLARLDVNIELLADQLSISKVEATVVGSVVHSLAILVWAVVVSKVIPIPV